MDRQQIEICLEFFLQVYLFYSDCKKKYFHRGKDDVKAISSGEERGIVTTYTFSLIFFKAALLGGGIRLFWLQQEPKHLLSGGHWVPEYPVSRVGAAGRSGLEWVSELRPVSVAHSTAPTLSLLCYTLGSHWPTSVFWKRKKFLRAFSHPSLLRWLHSNESIKNSSKAKTSQQKVSPTSRPCLSGSGVR